MGGRGCLSAKQHREQRQTPARSKTASLQLEKGARKTFPCLSPPFTSAWERETLAEVLTVPARRPRTRSRREGDRRKGREGAGVTGRAGGRGEGGAEKGRGGSGSASSGPRPTGYLGGRPLPLPVRRAQPPGAPRGCRKLGGRRLTTSEGADGPRRGGAGGGPPGAGPRVTWPRPPHVTATPRAPGRLPGEAASLVSLALCPWGCWPVAPGEAGWRSESSPQALRRVAVEPSGCRGSQSFVSQGTRDARGTHS